MALEYEGPIQDTARTSLDQFASELEQHRLGGPLEGRLVVAEQDLRGLQETMAGALAKWMKEDEYDRWVDQQRGRPVTTGGKVFIADDEVITAVVFPIDRDPEFLGIASHELVELADKVKERDEGWIPPEDVRKQDGLVLFDEYRNDRVRLEIATKLGWPESQVDREPGLVSQTEEIVQAMPAQRQPSPPSEFWLYWLNLARVWAMVAGRRGGGSASAAAELGRWSQHPLVADQGWQAIESACDDLYDQDGLTRDQLAEMSAARIYDRVIAHGKAAWAS